MQQLHECRDSRDNHFAARRISLRGFGVKDPITRITTNMHLYSEDLNTDVVLLNLQHIENIHLKRSMAKTHECFMVVDVLQRACFFMINDNSSTIVADHTGLLLAELVNEASPDMEHTWRDKYEGRRLNWKQSFLHVENVHSNLHNVSNNAEEDNTDVTITNICCAISAVIENACSVNQSTTDNNELNSGPESIMTSIETEYSLNTEQIHAFEAVAKHSLKNPNSDPLETYIGGPGGTGKSTVIHCIVEWFKRRNELYRLRLSSFTGAAANNIGGITIHSSLNLGSIAKPMSTGQASKELLNMWKNIDYFLIDKISLVSLEFLVTISESLSLAKENLTSFGGLSMIYAGDFRQLPPVCGTPLYSSLSKKRTDPVVAQTMFGQKAIAGRLLWLGLKQVFLLHQQMRQTGDENANFRELLHRICMGESTAADYDTLNSRVIEYADIDISTPEWFECPIITRQNCVKDVLIHIPLKVSHIEIKKTVQLYYRKDTRGGEIVTNTTELRYLRKLHTGQSKYLAALPLVIGMKVIILQNYDVPGGIINGSQGVLKSIRYKIDSNGNRHAISCVVTLPHVTCNILPFLAERDVVALEETTDFYIINPVTHLRTHYYRKQLPILLAYAMTDYKAQGQTLPYVIVDLESCHSLQSVYVMLSRATSLVVLYKARPEARARPSQALVEPSQAGPKP